MSESNGHVDKEELFARYAKRKTDDVTVDGLVFELSTVSDLEKSRYDAESVNAKGRLNRHAAISSSARAIQLICKTPAFSRSDIERIQELDSGFVERLAKACRKHAGWDEEPEKNSETTESDDSLTG